jgi:uncharacterized protein YciI
MTSATNPAPMYFMVIGTDKPGATPVRLATRARHRDWLRGPHERVKVVLSGASLERDSTAMNGSLLVVAADGYEDVLAFSQADPYAHAGLFASVEIRRWDWTFGNPEGPTASVNPI